MSKFEFGFVSAHGEVLPSLSAPIKSKYIHTLVDVKLFMDDVTNDFVDIVFEMRGVNSSNFIQVACQFGIDIKALKNANEEQFSYLKNSWVASCFSIKPIKTQMLTPASLVFFVKFYTERCVFEIFSQNHLSSISKPTVVVHYLVQSKIRSIWCMKFNSP